MFRKFCTASLFLGLTLLSPVLLAKQANVMQLKFHDYVNDYAHMLSAEKIESLDQKLSAYEKQTSNQIVVTTLTSIGDDTVEDVANQLFQKNGIGTKKHDNGVLLLIVKDGHHIRIEVGYGLEGELTDALSGMIIRNNIAPKFKQNNYDAGVQAGVNSMIQVIGGTYQAHHVVAHHFFLITFIQNHVGFIIAILIFIFIYIKPSGGSGFSGGSSGGGFSGGGGDFGGDFSGGGGDSGGGGASGDW